MKKLFMIGMAMTMFLALMLTSCKKDDTTNNGNNDNNDNNGGAQTGYVDLGLPSGTKWNSSNETTGSSGGLYTYYEAVSAFGDKLPTKEQLEELTEYCIWTWQNDSGFKVTGLNGNFIFLPATGYRSCNGGLYDLGSDGYYWSSTVFAADYAWNLYFNSGNVYMNNGNYRCSGFAVRLVQD